MLTLPRVGGGERRSRRRRRHRRTAIGLSGFVVLLCVAAVVGWATSRSSDDGGPEAGPGTTSPAPATGPDQPRALLVQTSAGGRVASVTVLALGREGEGGDVLLVPPGAMVEVPSFGLNPLREAYSLGGLALLQQAVENLLGTSFDEVGLADGDDLAAMTSPAGDLTVDVPDRVESVLDSGRVEVLFEAGPTPIGPDRVGALLAERGEGSDLERLVRHQRFWQAWLVAVATGGRESAPPARLAGGVAGMVRRLAAGPVDYHVLPVEALASGAAGDGELYRVDLEAVDELMARELPGARAASPEGRIEVQVLNGSGVPGLAQLVQPVLVDAGAEVSLTGNADGFDYETTQVVYYAEENLEKARAVQEALGVGDVVRSLQGLDVVDVTVVVGADFVAAAQQEGA